MPEIPSVGPGSVGPINRAQRAPARQSLESKPHALNGTGSGDRVELSDHARLLEQIRRLPEIRSDLVDRVRGEIAAGTYETPAKLDVAVERLAQDIAA
jgi:negative regulator of flagellin synthesis FlgM